MTDRYDRIARVIGGVLREALRSTRATGIVLLDADTPEGALVTRIAADSAIPLAEYGHSAATLTAHPASKTMLLAGEFLPRVDLFPLGDLYATQVSQLTDGWTGDAAVHALADAMGGIERLDEVLATHIDGRAHTAQMSSLMDSGQADLVRAALEQSRFRRARAGLVPKLGSRTIGVDLFD